jgi:hypothetical protein
MYSFKNFKINRDPYPHCFIENFLDDSVLDELNETFPTPEWFSTGKNGDGRVTSHTNRFNLSAGQYCATNFDKFIDMKENLVWKKLYEKVKSHEMTSELLPHFSQYLDQNNYIKSNFALPTFDITYQTDGYINPPHLDTPYHVFQMIIYIDTSKIVSGGDITIWNPDMTLSKSYKVKNNSCFAWLNTRNSFHAAYPALQGERRFVYIGFDSVLNTAYADRPAPHWHTFDVKNAKSPWRIYDLNKNSFI